LGARQFGFDIGAGSGWYLSPEDAALDPEAVSQVVRSAGFELLEVGLDVRGRLEWEPPDTAWLVPEGGERRLVRLVGLDRSALPGSPGAWRVRGRLESGADDDEPSLLGVHVVPVEGP
jgi:hypothetical protein